MSLSVRTLTVLRQYLGDNPDPAEVAAALREHGDRYLLRLPGLGRKSLAEIKEWLIEGGHSPDGVPAQHPARELSEAARHILKRHFGYYPLPEEVARTPRSRIAAGKRGAVLPVIERWLASYGLSFTEDEPDLTAAETAELERLMERKAVLLAQMEPVQQELRDIAKRRAEIQHARSLRKGTKKASPAQAKPHRWD